jgi:hypothetical protein
MLCLQIQQLSFPLQALIVLNYLYQLQRAYIPEELLLRVRRIYYGNTCANICILWQHSYLHVSTLPKWVC